MIDFKKRSKRGFTLVELLIVVAIIGILSTVGIPTFKRMVQKARKSEAKVALGGLFTTEAAFYSEYGAYGNNVVKIGFEFEGNNPIYSVGFPTDACADDTTAVPDKASDIGKALDASFPSYYGAPYKTFAGRSSGNCGNTGFVVLDANGTKFTAIASGAIAPGISSGAAIAEHDIWTIDNNRLLKNAQDGVK